MFPLPFLLPFLLRLAPPLRRGPCVRRFPPVLVAIGSAVGILAVLAILYLYILPRTSEKSTSTSLKARERLRTLRPRLPTRWRSTSRLPGCA